MIRIEPGEKVFVETETRMIPCLNTQTGEWGTSFTNGYELTFVREVVHPLMPNVAQLAPDLFCITSPR